MIRHTTLLIAVAVLLVACGDSQNESGNGTYGTNAAAPGKITSNPLAPRSKGAETMFTKLDPKETGLNYINPIKDPSTHPRRRLYVSSMVVGGVAVGDVDGDELPDLFFANGPVDNGLFRQTGNFTFEDITEKAGVSG
ncbi:MAG: hypothetical protein GWQ05_24955, partial [Verrucomicrobiaceae bacterium]|nr:hypothetical protein [Verrucomicrobiaceae bacterium]